VDDRFTGRKIKCSKCGARVVHVRDSRVELLTAGVIPPAGAAPAAPPPPSVPPAGTPPDDATPVATATVPHLVGEFVRQSESKQNVLIVGGLIGLFAASLSILGIAMDKPLLVFTPIGVALTIAAVWLWLRKKRHERQALASAKTGPRPKG
jgi:hypothetical protein